MHKKYCAVVNGDLPSFEGEINLPIGKDDLMGPPLQTIDPTEDGKDALTYWKVLDRGLYASKVSLFPHTGR